MRRRCAVPPRRVPTLPRRSKCSVDVFAHLYCIGWLLYNTQNHDRGVGVYGYELPAHTYTHMFMYLLPTPFSPSSLEDDIAPRASCARS